MVTVYNKGGYLDTVAKASMLKATPNYSTNGEVNIFYRI